MTMSTTKAYNRKDPDFDMNTPAGRLLFKSMLDWEKTGFNPWDENAYGTMEHYKSQIEYKKVPYGSFKLQAYNLAKILRSSSAPPTSTPAPQTMHRSVLTSPAVMPARNTTTTTSKSTDNLTLRSTLNEVYPCGTKIFVLFEIDGDSVDDDSCFFEWEDPSRNEESFSKITRWCRVPKEKLDAMELISESGLNDPQFASQDSDFLVINIAIKKRLEALGLQPDEHGEYWEKKEEIVLDFPCRPYFYNKKGESIKSYIIQRNEKGFTWGYFWLAGAHTEKPRVRPQRMGGKTNKPKNNQEQGGYGSKAAASGSAAASMFGAHAMQNPTQDFFNLTGTHYVQAPPPFQFNFSPNSKMPPPKTPGGVAGTQSVAGGARADVSMAYSASAQRPFALNSISVPAQHGQYMQTQRTTEECSWTEETCTEQGTQHFN